MAKNLIIVFGIVFLLVGILGFIPNGIVGANGFFLTNHFHDAVHLVSGILFLIIGFSAAGSSASALVIFGVVYALVAILGFILGSSVFGIAMNTADNWLHVVLALAFIISGSAGKSKMDMAMTA